MQKRTPNHLPLLERGGGGVADGGVVANGYKNYLLNIRFVHEISVFQIDRYRSEVREQQATPLRRSC